MNSICFRFITCLFILAVTLFANGTCFASQVKQVATVIAVKGEVQATNDQDGSRKLKVKTPLFENDILSTGNNGRLQIMFTDNTIISLGRKSTLQISEYIFNKDQTGKLTTKVSEGVFRVMGGILTKTSPDNFRTETPSGNIGIRGSMYTGQVSGGETILLFEGGKGITFKNQTGMVVISKPGNGTKVGGFNSIIPPPRKFSSQEIKSFHKELTIRPLKTAGKSGQTGGKAFFVPAKFSPQDAQKLKSESKDIDQEREKTQKEKSPEELNRQMAELTNQVKESPQEAARILHEAVTTKGLVVEKAMEAVLKGMKNPRKEDFDHLMNQAIDMGITLDGAKELVRSLRESGDICK